MREVDHRAMNLLGVIQSIVQLTRADSLPSFIEAVTGRIEALGRIHSLLACSRWEGAELSPLVREELAPFGRRIHIAGPVVKLRSTAAIDRARAPCAGDERREIWRIVDTEGAHRGQELKSSRLKASH